MRMRQPLYCHAFPNICGRCPIEQPMQAQRAEPAGREQLTASEGCCGCGAASSLAQCLRPEPHLQRSHPLTHRQAVWVARRRLGVRCLACCQTLRTHAAIRCRSATCAREGRGALQAERSVLSGGGHRRWPAAKCRRRQGGDACKESTRCRTATQAAAHEAQVAWDSCGDAS